MNKKLLYLITAKGIGDIVVRLGAIRSLAPHYESIRIVGPEFIAEFFNQAEYSSIIEVTPLKIFEKNASKYLKYVHTVIYSSRDHSFFGILKYSFLIIKTRSFLVKNFSIPHIFYLFGLFKNLSGNLNKSQNEFYLHQSLETLTKDQKENPFIYSTHPNSLKLINEINLQYKKTCSRDSSLKKSNKKIKLKKIIIFPGSKYQFRIWPYYKDLIIKLLSTNEYQITIMASKLLELDNFLEFESHKNISLKHSLSLTNVMKEINDSKLIVVNDSGPKHICTQCRTKYLAIEGGISDWSVVTYEKNCFSIFCGGFGANNSLTKKPRSKALSLINTNFVYSSIKILSNY